MKLIESFEVKQNNDLPLSIVLKKAKIYNEKIKIKNQNCNPHSQTDKKEH